MNVRYPHITVPLLGGMRCLINCPPGALGYFD